MKTRKAALMFLPYKFALATITLVQRGTHLASESERFPFLLNTKFTFGQHAKPVISEPSTTTTTTLEPQAKGESDVCFDRCLPNCCQKCATLEDVTYSGFNMTAKVSFAKCKWSGAISWASAITDSGSFEGKIENFDPREYKFFTVPAARFLHLQIHDGSFLVNGDDRMCQPSRGGYDQIDYWAGNCSGECGGESAACDVNISVPNPLNALSKRSRFDKHTTTTTTTTVEEAFCALFSYPDESGLNSEDSDESGLNREEDPAASFLSLGPLAFLRSVRFDGQPLHAGVGDTWLVRSSSVHIQGRYSMEDGGAVMSAIAIGGPVLDSKILLVEPESGSVKLNGYKLALGVSESEGTSGLVRVRNGDREYEETRPYAQVDIQLPGNIRVLINRYRQFLNFKVTMLKRDMNGVQGQCCVSEGTTENDSNIGLQASELNVLPQDSLFRFLSRKHNEASVEN